MSEQSKDEKAAREEVKIGQTVYMLSNINRILMASKVVEKILFDGRELEGEYDWYQTDGGIAFPVKKGGLARQELKSAECWAPAVFHHSSDCWVVVTPNQWAGLLDAEPYRRNVIFFTLEAVEDFYRQLKEKIRDELKEKFNKVVQHDDEMIEKVEDLRREMAKKPQKFGLPALRFLCLSR